MRAGLVDPVAERSCSWCWSKERAFSDLSFRALQIRVKKEVENVDSNQTLKTLLPLALCSPIGS
jgi:predicted DsbA family dithiol-disulfide isomerase